MKEFSRDTQMAISPDGNWAVAGSAGTVYLWNLNDGSLHSELLGDFDISHLEMTPDGTHVLIGAVSGVVAIWGITSKTLEFAFGDHTAARVLDVRMQENSDQLVCAFEDNTIRFWNKHSKMETGVLAGQFDGVDDSVIASNAIVAYSIYGDTIVASDLEQLIHLGSISLDYGITALAVVPDGTKLAVGDESGTVHFLSLERS